MAPAIADELCELRAANAELQQETRAAEASLRDHTEGADASTMAMAEAREEVWNAVAEAGAAAEATAERCRSLQLELLSVQEQNSPRAAGDKDLVSFRAGLQHLCQKHAEAHELGQACLAHLRDEAVAAESQLRRLYTGSSFGIAGYPESGMGQVLVHCEHDVNSDEMSAQTLAQDKLATVNEKTLMAERQCSNLLAARELLEGLLGTSPTGVHATSTPEKPRLSDRGERLAALLRALARARGDADAIRLPIQEATRRAAEAGLQLRMVQVELKVEHATQRVVQMHEEMAQRVAMDYQHLGGIADTATLNASRVLAAYEECVAEDAYTAARQALLANSQARGKDITRAMATVGSKPTGGLISSDPPPFEMMSVPPDL